MELYFVTSNKNKFAEARLILGSGLKQKKVEIEEVQEVRISRIIEGKAREAYKAVKKPVVVDDTGVFLTAMNGFPGALAKWLAEYMSNEEVCRLLDGKDRRAYAETYAAYFDGKKIKIFSGRFYGRIAEHPKGGDGWGWDPIFIPDGQKRTFAEMSSMEKMKISHRGRAFRKLKKYLDGVK